MPTSFRTLRFKMAGAFLLWTAVIQLGLLLLVPFVRERFILEELDRRLSAEATEIAAELASGKVTPEEIAHLPGVVSDDGRITTFAYQIDTAQGPVAASSRLRRAPLALPAPPPAGVAGPGRIRTLTVNQVAPAEEATPSRFRCAMIEAPTPGAGTLWLTVAASLQTADWLGHILRMTLLATLLPGLIGAGLAGWIVAGLLSWRIERIAREIRTITASRLEQRLPTEGSDEIARMARDINAMLDRLGGTIAGMERFMSEVSHELKTPVSALLTEAQVMKYSPPTPEAAARFILSVEDEMRRLGKLVESFLMLARFEHGRRYLAESAVPVNDVVLEAVEHATRPAEQSGVALNLNLYDPGEHGQEALVRGDSELLRIVFDNLIRNAIQFSDRNSTVSVEVGCENSSVRVAIRDRGPGAPPEHISKIFERYVQAPNQKGGRRGTGLGLAIAKGVVELHHGTIRAENHPGGGCVFTVLLPIAAQPRPSEREAAGVR